MKRRTILNACYVEFVVFLILSILFKVNRINIVGLTIFFIFIFILTCAGLLIVYFDSKNHELEAFESYLLENPIEVIPKKTDKDRFGFAKQLSKFAKFEAYLDPNDRKVNILVKIKDENTSILYDKIEIIEFFEFYDVVKK